MSTDKAPARHTLKKFASYDLDKSGDYPDHNKAGKDITISKGQLFILDSKYLSQTSTLDIFDLVEKPIEQYKAEVDTWKAQQNISKKQSKLQKIKDLLSSNVFGDDSEFLKKQALLQARIDEVKSNPKIPAEKKPGYLKSIEVKLQALTPLASLEEKKKLSEMASLLEKEIDLLQACVNELPEARAKNLGNHRVLNFDGQNYIPVDGFETIKINGKTYVSLEKNYDYDDDDDYDCPDSY